MQKLEFDRLLTLGCSYSDGDAKGVSSLSRSFAFSCQLVQPQNFTQNNATDEQFPLDHERLQSTSQCGKDISGAIEQHRARYTRCT